MNVKSIRNEISGRFKQMREALKLSQKQLAAQLGVARPSYTKYERGDTLPNVEALNTLAHTYGVSMDWLLTNKGPMFYREKTPPIEETGMEEIKGDLKELFDHMTRVPLLRYEILSVYQKFKLEYKNLVEPPAKHSED